MSYPRTIFSRALSLCPLDVCLIFFSSALEHRKEQIEKRKVVIYQRDLFQVREKWKIDCHLLRRVQTGLMGSVVFRRIVHVRYECVCENEISQ